MKDDVGVMEYAERVHSSVPQHSTPHTWLLEREQVDWAVAMRHLSRKEGKTKMRGSARRSTEQGARRGIKVGMRHRKRIERVVEGG